MNAIIVDDAMKAQLQAAKGPMVELCDKEGTLLAVVTWPETVNGRVPGMSLKDMEAMFTPEQLSHTRSETRSTITMEQVLRELESR